MNSYRRDTAELLFESSIYYYKPRTWEQVRDKSAKVYLYKSVAPCGHETIEQVYLTRYADLAKLLSHWSRQGWHYSEL